jgi:hypothetical protein
MGYGTDDVRDGVRCDDHGLHLLPPILRDSFILNFRRWFAFSSFVLILPIWITPERHGDREHSGVLG